MNPVVITPKNITPEILEFARAIGCTGEPKHIPIRPSEEDLVNKCHVNTEEKVKESGGSVVYGWTFWASTVGNYMTAEFHSVWKSPEGELLDVTPDIDGEDFRLFAPCPLVWTGFMRPNKYKALQPSPVLLAAIEAAQEKEKLHCLYKASETIPNFVAGRIVRLNNKAVRLFALAAEKARKKARKKTG